MLTSISSSARSIGFRVIPKKEARLRVLAGLIAFELPKGLSIILTRDAYRRANVQARLWSQFYRANSIDPDQLGHPLHLGAIREASCGCSAPSRGPYRVLRNPSRLCVDLSSAYSGTSALSVGSLDALR